MTNEELAAIEARVNRESRDAPLKIMEGLLTGGLRDSPAGLKALVRDAVGITRKNADEGRADAKALIAEVRRLREIIYDHSCDHCPGCEGGYGCERRDSGISEEASG